MSEKQSTYRAMLIPCEPEKKSREMIELPKGKGYLKAAQELVGGWIEYTPVCSGFTAEEMKNMMLVVNEEGVMRQLKPNHYASLLAGKLLVGDVILVFDSLKDS